MLLSILAELHLQQVLDHLVEDRRCVVLLGHLTVAIGHVLKEVAHLFNHLFALSFLLKVLVAILDHVLDLVHEGVLKRIAVSLYSGIRVSRRRNTGIVLMPRTIVQWVRLLVLLLSQLLLGYE